MAKRIVRLKTDQRVIKTRRVAYAAGNVGALLKDAAQISPGWNVLAVHLLVNPERGDFVIHLFFGRDTTAYVFLESADVPTVAAYLFATMQPRVAMAQFEPADDGDGEELPLPKISAAALAEMATVAGVQ
jgi:hypothetical protein